MIALPIRAVNSEINFPLARVICSEFVFIGTGRDPILIHCSSYN